MLCILYGFPPPINFTATAATFIYLQVYDSWMKSSQMPEPDKAGHITIGISPKVLFFVSLATFFVAGVMIFTAKNFFGDVNYARLWGPYLSMQVSISVVLLAAALFVILSKNYDAKDKTGLTPLLDSSLAFGSNGKALVCPK